MCLIFETYKRNIYSKNNHKNPRNVKQDTEFLNGGGKFWIKTSLKPQPYNCLQEIQKYISPICNNVSNSRVQNQESTDCRQMCNDCYYNIRNRVCPIFETWNSKFILRLRIWSTRNIKQDTKFLNRAGKFWIKMRLKFQSYNCNQEIQKYISTICINVSNNVAQNQERTDCREMCNDCYYNIRNEVCAISETYSTRLM